jgi:hypothetical protein
VTAGTYEAMNDLNLSKLYVVSPTTDAFLLHQHIEVLGVKALVEILLEKS